ncbi:hypothetical protein DFH09DRAFT_1310982 [Mycena vulgaris]|nr:hypothetical protein DFH09DRAFT_1310982 [Mycena vulgaris]
MLLLGQLNPFNIHGSTLFDADAARQIHHPMDSARRRCRILLYCDFFHHEVEDRDEMHPHFPNDLGMTSLGCGSTTPMPTRPCSKSDSRPPAHSAPCFSGRYTASPFPFSREASLLPMPSTASPQLESFHATAAVPLATPPSPPPPLYNYADSCIPHHRYAPRRSTDPSALRWAACVFDGWRARPGTRKAGDARRPRGFRRSDAVHLSVILLPLSLLLPYRARRRRLDDGIP